MTRVLRAAAVAVLGALLCGAAPSPTVDLYSGQPTYWMLVWRAPLTAATMDQLRADSSHCQQAAQRKARGSDAVELHAAQRPAFLACMKERNWTHASAEDYEALTVMGTVQDCLDGVEDDCAAAVNAYVAGVPGTGVPMERSDGLDAGRKLCSRGNGSVCLTMASIHLHLAESQRLPAEGAAALRYGESGCRTGHGPSCALVGSILVTPGHPGIPMDEVRGGALLERACALGETHACNWPWKPAETRSADLPQGASWCRYVLDSAEGADTCPESEVLWISVAEGATCSATMTSAWRSCRYSWALGD